MSHLAVVLDMMGGDMSPRITICELVKALGKYPMLSLLFANNQQIFLYVNVFQSIVKII